MSASNTIKVSKSEGVARITFARPKHNVFNISMMNRFNETLADVAADVELKCVVICGEGASWCAGVDVGDHKPDMVHEMIAVFDRSLKLMHTVPVPLIAAVHGACLGGGMEYAIACDIVVASRKAVFGQPEIKLGFFPPYAAVRLPQLIGPAKAVEVCTTGKIYSADEGFVSRVADPEALTETVDKVVRDISYNSPLIIRLNKRAVTDNLGLALTDSMPRVNDFFLNTLMKTEDTLEGIASFEEKRKPQWKNK